MKAQTKLSKCWWEWHTQICENYVKWCIVCCLTWLPNKALAAVSAHALKGKHNCQSSCSDAKILVKTAVTGMGQNKSDISVHWDVLYNPHPGNSLISRTYFYIYEMTNSGLSNPKWPDVERVGNRLLMQTLFQCQPWRCPLLDNM